MIHVVDQHSAGSALAAIAAELGAGETELVAQRVRQRLLWQHVHGPLASVDVQRDETLDGKKVTVMERYPAYKHSGYTRQIVWVDLDIYQARKVEYYDRKNALLKTLKMSEFNQYDGKHWRPHNMDMVNHQTGKSTALTWSDFKFGNGFSDANFSKNSLKRAR